MNATIEAPEVVETVLATFRRKPDGGQPVEIRIVANVGRKFKVVNVRKWVKIHGKHGKWIPTREGVALGPHEIDAAIEALRRAKLTLDPEPSTPAPVIDRSGSDATLKAPWED